MECVPCEGEVAISYIKCSSYIASRVVVECVPCEGEVAISYTVEPL